jgi:suppressor of fused
MANLFGRKNHPKDTGKAKRVEAAKAPSESAPGWDAIAAACAAAHPGLKEHHLGTVIKYALGGPDPLDGVSVFVCRDHWHFVSFGLSDLYRKTDDGDTSGWGFELTFRLRHDGSADIDEQQPPMWPVVMMQSLARYVMGSGAILWVGDHIDASNVLDEEDSAYRAIAIVLDPELGEIDSPHGPLEFRQIVLISEDELEACKVWNSGGLLSVLAESNPLWISDAVATPERFGPSQRAAVERGADEEGSSYSQIYADRLQLVGDVKSGPITIAVSSLVARETQLLLRRRLKFGKAFWIRNETTIGIGPTEEMRNPTGPSTTTAICCWRLRRAMLPSSIIC